MLLVDDRLIYSITLKAAEGSNYSISIKSSLGTPQTGQRQSGGS